MQPIKLYSSIVLLSALSMSVAAQTTCEVTGTTPGEACLGGSGTISATGMSGNTIKWYDQMTGGNLLHTGTTYTVNNVTSPAIYYAEASDGGVIVQDSINTLTPNNGQVVAMFDCKPLTDLTVTGMNFVPRSSGNYVVSVYFKSGTLVGSESNSSAWTLLGTSSSFNVTANNLTNIPITMSQSLTASQTYAFYVHASTGGSLGYTNGSTLELLQYLTVILKYTRDAVREACGLHRGLLYVPFPARCGTKKAPVAPARV